MDGTNADNEKHSYLLIPIVSLLVIVLCIIASINDLIFLKYVALSIIIMFILMMRAEHNVVFCLFLWTSYNMMIVPEFGFSLVTFGILISFVKHLMTRLKKAEFDNTSLLIMFLIIVYEWLHFLFIYFEPKYIFVEIRWSLLLAYATIICVDKNFKFNIRQVIYTFVFSMILSTVYGLCTNLNIVNNFGLERFAGATGDPNYFSMNIILSAVCMLILIMNEEKRNNFHTLLFYLLLFIGLLSLSRMYFILLFIVFVALILRSLGKMKIKFLLISLVVVCLCFVFFNNYIVNLFNQNIDRFVSNSADELTSNRNILLRFYWDVFNSNLANKFFGIGLQDYQLRVGIDHVTHNSYLEVLISWGVVGMILWIVFIYKLHKQTKIKYSVGNRRGIISYLPIILIYISALSLSLTADNYTYFLLVFMISVSCYDFSKNRGSLYNA